MQGRFQHGTRWLVRGTLIGTAFVVLLVLYSLPMLLENAELIRTWLTGGVGKTTAQLPLLLPPASLILKPVLFAFLLGLVTSSMWAYFARSRLGLLWSVLAGLALPFFFAVVTVEFGEFLFMASFTTFDVPTQTVPIAVAQLSGREPQPLYLTVLYTFSSLLPGAVLWAGLRFATLRRL